MREVHDTVVVGGGQAGLAMSWHLQARGREHVLLERQRIAERWRTERWDSLHFQLPNHWLALPGKAYNGPHPDGFSHHADVIRFIETYATEIDAPVRIGVTVTGLRRDEPGGYVLDTTAGPIHARHVVIATGPFQQARTSSFARAISPDIHQTDTSHYRNPAQLPPGAVLVVGAGNSGCQIADELNRAGRQVFLAVSKHSRAPRRYRGKDVIWWLETLGRFDVNVDSFPGRKYPPTSIMTGIGGGYDLSPRHLGTAGVRLVGRILGVSDGVLTVAGDVDSLIAGADMALAAFIEACDAFAMAQGGSADLGPPDLAPPLSPLPPNGTTELDLRAEGISTIVWSAGFDYDFSWISLPILDSSGAPVQTRGVTASPGVYFLGLHWMHTFRSAILAFVGRDAAYIVDHIGQLAT